MGRLGYDRWFAHGGGWGARLTAQLGLLQPEGLEAVHLATYDDFDPGAAAAPALDSRAGDVALTDSPAGLAAWMFEAYAPGIDRDASSASSLGVDEVLDNVMMHWLANTAAAGRAWRPRLEEQAKGELTVPVGCSQFAHCERKPRELWTGLPCRDLFYWNAPGPVARFPALQQPDVLVAELRRCFTARTWREHPTDTGSA
jgi:hypothetical protein